MQDKSKEIAFFDSHAEAGEYDVFSPASNSKLVDACIRSAGWKAGGLVADFGCGSGVFTNLLRMGGFSSFGLDLSYHIIAAGKGRFGADFVVGDVERLPLRSESLDGVLLSNILHHLPQRSACISEIERVLKPGAAVVAFDPNRRNPFMYLYRDKSSPFYSSVGVSENERPILAEEVAQDFRTRGFGVRTDYVSGLSYRYIASPLVRPFLPLYNRLDDMLFQPKWMRAYSPFVLTIGVKA